VGALRRNQFRTLTQDDFDAIARELNERPRQARVQDTWAALSRAQAFFRVRLLTWSLSWGVLVVSVVVPVVVAAVALAVIV
jgi:hypothetical protein